MIFALIPAILLLRPQAQVLDSIGHRRPRVQLPAIAAEWTPSVLRNRQILDFGSDPRSTKARKGLLAFSTEFVGPWKTDFATFRRIWPRSLADGSWSVLVAAFWRTRPGQEFQGTPGLKGPEAAMMLRDWTKWLETTDLRVRLALSEATSRELSIAGEVGSSKLSVGESLVLDLGHAKFGGPLGVRIERFVRKGASFPRLVASDPPANWTAPAAHPVWKSGPFTVPGLYRVVWEARGFYQQSLVSVGGLQVMGIATDSGMLVWASGVPVSKARMVWKDLSGIVDSVSLDLSSPVHIGFPAASDSGLVVVASGDEFATLRLHRAHPSLQDSRSWSEERDRWGRPQLVPPRVCGASGWQAASVLERDAYEAGDLLKVSGWFRHLDAYGRPDAKKGDSLRWSMEPFSGATIQRWVKPDPNGWWSDSVQVGIKGRAHVDLLAAERVVLRDPFCEEGSLFRVRDVDNSCLETRPVAPVQAAPRDTLGIRIGGKSRNGALFVVTQGRALDWIHPMKETDSLVETAIDPILAAGGSAFLATPAPNGWTAWRHPLAQVGACAESRFPLTLSSRIPDQVAVGTPLPEIAIASRSGGPVDTKMTVSVRLAPDSLAGSLRPFCAMLGKSRAASEIYTGDGNWNVLGQSEPEFQDYDKRRDPDVFARLGLRPFPAVCIACTPWLGSWDTKPGQAELPPKCGWGGQNLPCRFSDSLANHGSSTIASALDSAAIVVAKPVWPRTAGYWRLQIVGIDSQGRLLAWEKVVQAR